MLRYTCTYWYIHVYVNKQVLGQVRCTFSYLKNTKFFNPRKICPSSKVTLTFISVRWRAYYGHETLSLSTKLILENCPIKDMYLLD